jgi:hypothetical protein
MDMMRDSISDILQEVVGVRPIHPAPRLNTNALAIPKNRTQGRIKWDRFWASVSLTFRPFQARMTDARPPHPPHRCAPQARA